MASAAGLPVPMYWHPAQDFGYSYMSQMSQLPAYWPASSLNQWSYVNCLTTQNLMASMYQISLNSTRLSPRSRDSGISSDSAISPDKCSGSLDLSMKCNKAGKKLVHFNISKYILMQLQTTVTDNNLQN